MLPVPHGTDQVTFKLAGGTEENDLPVTREVDDDPGSPTYGSRIFTSYWEPSVAELSTLAEGGHVRLSVWGAQVPVSVGVEPRFGLQRGGRLQAKPQPDGGRTHG